VPEEVDPDEYVQFLKTEQGRKFDACGVSLLELYYRHKHPASYLATCDMNVAMQSLDFCKGGKGIHHIACDVLPKVYSAYDPLTYFEDDVHEHLIRNSECQKAWIDGPRPYAFIIRPRIFSIYVGALYLCSVNENSLFPDCDDAPDGWSVVDTSVPVGE
jgi:hypothetical protein